MTEEEKKIELVSKINWDYSYTAKELLDVISNKNDNSLFRLSLYIKSLTAFTWQDLIYLWTIDECNRLYTEKVRRALFPRELRETYDDIFELLRTKTLSRRERTLEEFEKFKATILFKRQLRIELNKKT